MEIAKPLSRLLLACILMMVLPIYLGMGRHPVYWIAVPAAILTFISCSVQGYRSAGLVIACAASISVALAGVYAIAYLAAGLRPA